MSSLSTFIMLLDQFLEELDRIFPENKSLKSYKFKYDALKVSNPRLAMNKFMQSIKPMGEFIVNKDETLFSKDTNIEIVKELQLDELWNTNLSNNTREAIWAHLNTLYVFGSTISIIPEGMMESIEGLAQQCASNMKDQNPENIDTFELMKGVQNIFNK